MTDQTLIERLEVIEHALRVSMNTKDAKAVKEAIAALSPVLPEHVRNIAQEIRSNSHIDCVCYDLDAPGLLERLARDNMLREDEILHRENIAKEQEQYIKKLEDATKIQASHITDLEDQINERT